MFADEGLCGFLEFPVGFFVVGGGHAGEIWRFGEGHDGLSGFSRLGRAVRGHDGGSGSVVLKSRARSVSTVVKALMEEFGVRRLRLNGTSKQGSQQQLVSAKLTLRTFSCYGCVSVTFVDISTGRKLRFISTESVPRLPRLSRSP